MDRVVSRWRKIVSVPRTFLKRLQRSYRCQTAIVSLRCVAFLRAQLFSDRIAGFTGAAIVSLTCALWGKGGDRIAG